MIEKTWIVWVKKEDGTEQAMPKTFYDEGKADNYANWLRDQKDYAEVWVIPHEIETNP